MAMREIPSEIWSGRRHPSGMSTDSSSDDGEPDNYDRLQDEIAEREARFLIAHRDAGLVQPGQIAGFRNSDGMLAKDIHAFGTVLFILAGPPKVLGFLHRPPADKARIFVFKQQGRLLVCDEFTISAAWASRIIRASRAPRISVMQLQLRLSDRDLANLARQARCVPEDVEIEVLGDVSVIGSRGHVLYSVPGMTVRTGKAGTFTRNIDTRSREEIERERLKGIEDATPSLDTLRETVARIEDRPQSAIAQTRQLPAPEREPPATRRESGRRLDFAIAAACVSVLLWLGARWLMQ